MPNTTTSEAPVKAVPSKTAVPKRAVKNPAAKAVSAKPKATISARGAVKIVAKKAANVPIVKRAVVKTVAVKAAVKSVAKAVSPIVRDSFTMTAADQELLKKCKRDAIASGRESTKKSEIVRAALRHFASLAASTQLMELNGLDPVKTGRPKKK